MGSYRSKEDEVLKISTSIFVANFPDSFGAKDLWNTCKQYGQVVDAYIPYRRSKACKRLVLYALSSSLHDIDGLKRGNSGDTYNSNGMKGAANSYAHVVKGSQNSKMDLDSRPVMLLDDSCLNEKYYSLCFMGKVKDFATLANLKVVVANEGFHNIKFKYMGWYWIQLAFSDFNNDGRLTWVEIECIPLKMWSKNTFNHVASKWGVLLDVDDQEDEHFHRKRIYFVEDNDEEEDSEVGSYEEVPNGEDVKNVEDLEGDSDGEIIPDTKFEEDFPNQKGEEYSVGQGGSILQLIDDLVKEGETMGYDIKGCMKNMEEIIELQGANDGDWMPNGKKLLIISVYAPQELSEKKMLWDYLSLVMSKWEGEVVIMGYFNEEKSQKSKRSLLAELADCDAIIDKGEGENNVLNRRTEVVNLLLEVEKKNSLEAAQKEKIKDKTAMWDCGIDKSSGPDGFMFGFYLRYWKLIENDVVDAVMCFFHQGLFPKGGNSSFIILISKPPNANMVRDYKPISLFGSMYKIISKILANRLVVCKKKKKQSLVFKVDFEKAYDSVRWDHLDDIMRKFDFGEKWCMWIQSCLRSSRGSIIMNGSPMKEFQFYKGLKQADPLSPFLFILVRESLHISFQRVVDV
nr:RNA-directed DNA polymerase, eukaryota [Tanacetum cinerariifolium]